MGINLGNGYLTSQAGAEIVHYLIQSLMLKKVTKPINGSEIQYHSVLNDRSSSAKTMYENELFLVTPAPTGVPNLSVLSVEEVVETDHEGLKAVLDHAMEKVAITINRSDKEIEMCTDGT